MNTPNSRVLVVNKVGSLEKLSLSDIVIIIKGLRLFNMKNLTEVPSMDAVAFELPYTPNQAKFEAKFAGWPLEFQMVSPDQSFEEIKRFIELKRFYFGAESDEEDLSAVSSVKKRKLNL